MRDLLLFGKDVKVFLDVFVKKNENVDFGVSCARIDFKGSRDQKIIRKAKNV